MKEPIPTEPAMARFHAAIPILRVRRNAVSLDFDGRVLGFQVDWNVTGMASVSRGGCRLMLDTLFRRFAAADEHPSP